MNTAPTRTATPTHRTARAGWERNEADLARLLFALVVCAVATAWAKYHSSDAENLATDLVALLSHVPDLLVRFLVGVLQVAAVVVPVGSLLYARKGRWLELALAVGGAVAAGLLASVINGSLRDSVPPAIAAGSGRPSWITGAAFPSGSYVAAVVAAVVIVAPTLTRAWRRAALWTVAMVCVARVLAAVEPPLNLLATAALGMAVGSLVLLVAGSPSRRPTIASISEALAVAGVGVERLDVAPERTHHGPAFVGVAGGRPIFVKVVGRDERDADMLSRFVRFLRVKGVEDDRPTNPRLLVEREALSCLMAERAGASVARVQAVGETDERAGFVAFDRLEGRTVDTLEVDDITDPLLRSAFHQLALLHRARIAHRWPSVEHLMAAGDDTVQLIDFRWAQLGADDELLAADLAEMLASFAARVGAERTVAAAATEFDAAALGSALPRLQPLAVSSDTRRALKHDKGILGEVRAAAQAAAGVESYELVAIQRLTVNKVISFLGVLVVGNLLLGLAANWSDIWGAMKGVSLANVPVMLLGVGISYAVGALCLMGAVNVRLPFLRTTLISFAQSFLNRFIPANAGGMALRARYLQKSGVELVVAAASVGLTSAASGIMQVVFAVVFFSWAGSSAEAAASFHFPAGKVVMLVVVVALVVGGLVYFTTFGRRIFERTKIQVRKLLHEFRLLATRPAKLVMLFGAPFLGKAVSVWMLSLALHAFGVHLSFPVLGAMYITATTVASAVPTPGGVGAIEAALTAGLIGLRVDAATAAAAVLWFRLFTYWLPVLPCWLAYRRVVKLDIA